MHPDLFNPQCEVICEILHGQEYIDRVRELNSLGVKIETGTVGKTNSEWIVQWRSETSTRRDLPSSSSRDSRADSCESKVPAPTFSAPFQS